VFDSKHHRHHCALTESQHDNLAVMSRFLLCQKSCEALENPVGRVGRIASGGPEIDRKPRPTSARALRAPNRQQRAAQSHATSRANQIAFVGAIAVQKYDESVVCRIVRVFTVGEKGVFALSCGGPTGVTVERANAARVLRTSSRRGGNVMGLVRPG
jgi:hypothetical protein